MSTQKHLDLASIRARLEASQGKEYWRCLEELAETEEFQEFLHREFPRQAASWSPSISRRQFVKLMGASLALAGLTGCGARPVGKIVPYVKAPDEAVVPGKPLYFATAMPLSGYALGLLVESHMGRPTKVEGNPDHPASLGATDAFAQAAVLTLYDPDRSQAVTNQGRIRPWDTFLTELSHALDEQKTTQGAGLRLLTESISSPTLANQIQTILTQFPAAKWHQYEPVGRDNTRAGNLLAFGEDVHPVYQIGKANVILALDADFLACRPGTLRYVHDFAERRRVATGATEMNRLYAIDNSPTLTGSAADHRLRVRASEVEAVARAIAARVGVEGVVPSALPPTVPPSWIDALVRDLQQNRGSSLVIAGESQTPTVTALAHAMNQVLGNVGNTIIYTEPVVANPVDLTASLRELIQDMDAGRVELLVVISGNPVYTAPADLHFAESFMKVPLRIHLSLYDDETSALSHWHIPETHFLETWSDARAYDGTVSIIQPLIAPLYAGKSAHELLAAFTGESGSSAHDIVRAYWQSQNPSGDFEQFWQQVLNAGAVPNTALQPKSVSLQPNWTNQVGTGNQGPGQPAAGTQPAFEIVFQPDPNIYDGRFANNGWLQELPKTVTKLTWDNAALISPQTAERLGLSFDQAGVTQATVVELHYKGRMVQAPIFVLPGQADNSITVYLGYGRTRAGRVGTGAGFNAYAIRTSTAPWFDSGLEIRATGQRVPLATTQHHWTMEGRKIVQAGTLQQYRENPYFVDPMTPTISIYPGYSYQGRAWGMAIDLTACTGCNACVVACQAENNIPVVGKDQVLMGREMHWLRVDRYYTGRLDNPEVFHQPVPCMHCETAPCEVVCPVAATVHSKEGLNDMIYNRCVGTRYCSNNCPYKVRRFNFLQFADWDTPSLKLLRNPEVTVRSRGVMEKCTYCVQRIRAAEIEAEKENREIRDGEIVTACQAACPSQAIVFGNILDSNSRVARLKAQPLNYSLLGELNTRPRTTYLAALRNPNPEIETE
ncbi:MAG: TAT-variant-translocated molybdopterin oxidoreductase [Ardenticatenaceae bacterium]|nr:TAT-variant-translocated molybdopterin oxidoreductase [Ardenticatenaceae bacterium]